MKNIWFINQAAGSPYHGMVFRTYYLANEMVKQGHNVTVFSGSFSHNYFKLPVTSGLYTEEYIDGIRYVWVKLPQYSQSKSLGRILSMFLFPFLLLFYQMGKNLKPNAIIVSSPPPVAFLAGLFWSWRTKAKLIFEVRDIWPLSIQLLGGYSKNNLFILILGFIEKLAYKTSDFVSSVLPKANLHFISRGMRPDKFIYVPNGVLVENVEGKDSATLSSLLELKSQGKFIVGYTGTIGFANALSMLIDAAKKLKDHKDIHFVLIGEGSHKKLIEKTVLDYGLSNVSTFQPVTKKEIPLILDTLDVGYIGLLKDELFQFGISPNKIFDYMLAKLPVIMAIDAGNDLVKEANCGISVPSCEPEEIADAVLKLQGMSKDERSKLGENGHSFVLKNHLYKNVANIYLDKLNSTKSKSSQTRWITSPFWLGFWIVMVAGLVAHQVLPLFAPHLFKDGMTIFLDDPHNFHNIGLEVASRSWLEFDFRPQGQFPAGILAFFYKLTGIFRPVVILPLLGMMAGLTMRGIASCLDVLGVSGRWWPLLIGLVYTVTPTSLSWMIYPHKDSFIVPGVMLMTWAFIAVAQRKITLKHVISLIVGSLLVFTSKPHFAELFFAGTLLAIPFAGWKAPRLGRMTFFVFGLILFGSVAIYKRGYLEAGEGAPKIQNTEHKIEPREVRVIKPRHIDTRENWEPLPIIGKTLNKALLAVAYTRERFLYQRSHGNTNFMPEVHLEGAWDTIKFIPRAFQLALLEPLPWRGIEGGRARQLVFGAAKLEMLLVYLSLLFLITSGRKSWSPAVLICVALSIPFLFALGFAAPNVGAINRYRFPFLILIKLAGFSALWNSNRFKWPGRSLMWIDPPRLERAKKKLLYLVVDDEAFLIQRLVMAQAAQKAGYDVHVACPDTGHAKKISELGFIHHNVDLNRGGLNPVADIKPFIKLVFFLAKERPDILHNVSIKPVIYGATAGTIVGLSRIVCLINGLGYAFEGKGFKGKIVFQIAKALYQNALALPGVRVIFQNPDDRDYFVKNDLVDEHKTLLIRGSGVNTTKFAPSPQSSNPVPVVLFVGRLLRSKGVEDLIEASKILKSQNIKFTLRFVGQPDEKNPESLTWEFLKKMESEGIVELMGRQSDMPKFYREADVVVLPQQNREGLPLTLLEASSCSRAIIATDVPGCREIIRHEINGLKVPPKNPEALAEAIKRLVADADLRKKYGEAGAEIVKNEFAAEIIQKQLLDVYDGLLNDHEFELREMVFEKSL